MPKIIFHSTIVSLVLVFTLSLFADIKILWGLNFGKFLPLWWQILIVGIAWLTLIPKINKEIINFLDRFSKLLLIRKNLEIIITSLFFGIMIVLFILIRSKIFFLGDGLLRLNQIYQGQLYLPTEIGDFFIHSFIFQTLFKSYNIPAELTYQILSPVGGLVFLGGAYRLAKCLHPNNFVSLFLVFISSGIMVMFFGYLESYALVAGLLPWAVLSAIKLINGEGGIIYFIIICITAGILHPIGIILFLGLLIGLPVIKKDRDIKYYRKLLTAALIGTVVLIVSIYILQTTGVITKSYYLLPLFPSEISVHGYLTSLHGWDVLNWLMLAALPLIPYLLVLPFMSNKLSFLYSRKGLLAVLFILPSLLFILFFIPHLNGPRDWDLFSLPVFLIMAGYFVFYLSNSNRRLSGQLLPLIVIAMFNTGAFAYINSNKPLSADRFEEVINVTKNKNLYIDYALLYDLSRTDSELYERLPYYAHKAWEQPPYKAEDSVHMADQLARIYIQYNKPQQAKYFVDQAIRADSNNVTGYLAYISYLEKFGNPDEIRELAEMLEVKFSDDAFGRMNAGVFFVKIGLLERAQENLEIAYRLDSLDEKMVVNYGALLYHLMQFDRCIEILSRDIQYVETNFQRYSILSNAYRAIGDRERAIENYHKAVRFAVDPQQKQVLTQIGNSLGL